MEVKMERLRNLAKAQLTANGDFDVRVDRIISALTVTELREIAEPIVRDLLWSLERAARVEEEFTKTVEVKTIHPVTGKTEIKEVEIPPSIQRVMKVVPRDMAGQLERMSVREAEQKALRDLRNAFTRNQRVAAFVALKQHTISLGDGKEVPWHEATTAQRNQRIKMLGEIIKGTKETRELLEAANALCGAMNVSTLAEAEALSQKAA
jgi:hypothetical protein